MLNMISCLFICLMMGTPSFGFTGKIHVVDGDTIDVGDVRVRLHGVDAPESDQKCVTENNETWACGLWVSEQLRNNFEGRSARCKVVDIDRYGRKVATCKSRRLDIGNWLVYNGLASAYLKYSSRYEAVEQGAIRENRGLHAMRMQTPAEYRKTRIKGRVPPNPDCPIKGNISADGRRIFHSPGQQFYERTGIDLKKGERWFCSAAQAKTAGWIAALR